MYVFLNAHAHAFASVFNFMLPAVLIGEPLICFPVPSFSRGQIHLSLRSQVGDMAQTGGNQIREQVKLVCSQCSP